MKKTILLTGALIGMSTSILQAAPSWLEILSLKTKIYHAQISSYDLEKIFKYNEHTTPPVNFKKLFSQGSSQLGEAQKVAKQLRVINGMITWTALNNNFRTTRALFSPFLKVLLPCSAGGTMIGKQFTKHNNLHDLDEDKSQIGFVSGSLVGCLLGIHRIFRIASTDLYPDKEYTQDKLNQYRKISTGIQSSLKNDLPQYLEKEGFPKTVIQSTMNTLNKPTATQLIKQTFLRALKR